MRSTEPAWSRLLVAAPRRRPGTRAAARALMVGALAFGSASFAAASGDAPAVAAVAHASDLTALSLDELMNVKVSTVSRKPERWWSAPSGVDVVSGDDIRRAGALNLPDALRLGTGVHVGQSSARSWAVSIRGMNVLAANKISVAMDGRSLFTPFFSGVQWDAQDTLLEDVDRIEVVRGPVGALWGAFAVNGFIQILTKPAWDTQGWLLSAGTGTEDPGLFAARYGGALGQDTFYRAYAKYLQTDWTYRASGEHAQPATDYLQGGFRVDHRRARDTTITVQGDYYTNRDLLLDRLQAQVSGSNVLGRWRRTLSPDSDIQVDGYFDHTYRLIPLNFEESRSTGSASFKYRLAAGRHGLLFGADALVSGDEIGNNGVALLVPPKRTTHTAGLYAQDAVHLGPSIALVLGLKAEQGSFSGLEIQPTFRFAWTPGPNTTAWAAVSRAVRPPVRIDEDLVIRFSGVDLFAANDDFKTETAFAAEVGLRHRPASWLTFDMSTFAYRYDNLRSTEPAGPTAIPSTFLNSLEARSYGAEVSVMYQPIARLFVKGSYRILDLDFSADPGSRDTSNGSAEGNDPKHVAVVGAHLTLPANLELDGFLRLASALPKPAIDGYTTVDARIGWRASRHWEISVAGRNLLGGQYPEFITTNSLNEEVHRRGTVKVTWRH
jgi:iron complex outermembrane recepter protein